MKIHIPSPAIAIVGRHNSGKTTLVEKLIASLVAKGLDVGSIKHHSHKDFDIDYPGKDSYRHRAAGASETVIASPVKIARVKTLAEELECSEIVESMPGHDIIIVEGYRKSGLPTIEIMRAANEADSAVADVFYKAAISGKSLEEDSIQAVRGESVDARHAEDIAQKMPASSTVAIVSDIDNAIEAAKIYGISAFSLDDIEGITEFLIEHYARHRMSVVIQAGGESRRMGRSKATVPFCGRPLICNLIDRVSLVADELIITTNERENLEFLFDAYPELNIRLIPDKYDFRGALPGLYTALEAASCPYVAVVACDMIFASGSLMVAEAIEMANLDADIVVPVNKHGFEPFHAMYRKQTCLPAVLRAIEANESKVQSVFNDDALKVVEFAQERVLKVEPHGGCFINANTPEELSRIEETYIGE